MKKPAISKLNYVLNHLNEMVWITNSDLKLKFINDTVETVLGYRQDEIKSLTLDNIITPNSLKVVQNKIADKLAQKRNSTLSFAGIDTVEIEYTHKNGDIVYGESKVCLYRRSDGKPLEVIGVTRNIAEHKQAKLVKGDLSEKYYALYQQSLCGIVIVDIISGTIIEANNAFIELVGYSADELRLKKIWELRPPELQTESEALFEKYCFSIDADTHSIYNLPYQNKDGTIVPVDFQIRKINIDGNQMIMGMVRDLSEKQHLEQKVKKSELVWQESFDAIEHMMLVTDGNYLIRQANLATLRTMNKEKDEILGQPCYRVFHNLSSPPKYCPYAQVQKTGKPQEYEINDPNLKRIFCYACYPMNAKKSKRIVHVINDVTHVRQQELLSQELSQSLAESFQGTSMAFVDLQENRDPYTVGHSQQVTELVTRIALKMDFDEHDIEGIQASALLHDIGKIAVPSDILNKPGKLASYEMENIKQHPVTAYNVLGKVPFPWPIAEVIRQHHERLDGSGYPLGVKGDKIHLWARILAVADTVDAMVSHRPYRPALPIQVAKDEIATGRGILYDPDVVDVVMSIIE